MKEVEAELKDKIDRLFGQAFLGGMCLYYGKFCFQGKEEDKLLDQYLGFSIRQHKKRTQRAYMLLDDIMFKNSYLLLSSILEESYNLILEVAEKHGIKSKALKQYTGTGIIEEIKRQKSKKVRFLDLAYSTHLIANVVKHTGGMIQEEKSGEKLMKLIKNRKLKKGNDIVALRNYIKVNNVIIGNLPLVITRLYICIIDIVADIFEFHRFRITNAKLGKNIDNMIDWEIRPDFIQFIESIKDGSVIY